MPVPELLAVRTVAKTRFFRIEELDLRFASGEERTYERLPGGGRAAVIVVPVTDDGNVMLIREYAAGFHEMQLTLVKGVSEGEESLEETANRELKEEIGMGARRLRFIKKLNLAPGHMGFTINVLLAQDLFPEKLEGDEPEPLEIIPWPVEKLDELISSDEFNEARAIAALTLARPFL